MINDKKNRFFLITLILIVLFDVLILGFYFGSEKLLKRYSFLQNEINEYLPSSGQQKLFYLEAPYWQNLQLLSLKNLSFLVMEEVGLRIYLKINFQNLST